MTRQIAFTDTNPLDPYPATSGAGQAAIGAATAVATTPTVAALTVSAAIRTLSNQLRSDLITLNAIKGSA